MNLVKYQTYTEKEVKAVEVLAPSSQAFILALMETKISVLEPRQSNGFIYDALKLAEIQSGLTKIDNKDLIQLAEDVRLLVLDKYASLTKSELVTAFKNGAIGNYGEWYGMCLKSVNQWLKGYMNNEARVKAIKEWNAQIEKSETSDKPLAHKLFFSKKSCLSVFENYKLFKKVPFGAFAYYDIINDLIGVDYNGVKTLVTDPIVRKEVTVRLKDRHTKELLHVRKHSIAKGNLSEAEALMSVIAGDFKDTNSLSNMIKGEFLTIFFDQLIKENKNLEL